MLSHADTVAPKRFKDDNASQ